MCNSVHVQSICQYTLWQAHSCVRHLIVQMSDHFIPCYTFSQGFCRTSCKCRLQCKVSSTWFCFGCSGDEAYHRNVATFYQNHLDKEKDLDAQLITNWDNLFWASNVLLANLTASNPAEAGSFHQATQGFLKQWVCGSGGTVT